MYTPTITIFHSQFLRTPLLQTSSLPPLTPSPRSPTTLSPLRATDGQGGSTGDAPPPPPNAVEIRFRRRSRRKGRQRQGLDGEVREPMATAARTTAQAPKKWEEMTLSEKALELYMGEKGALFWLNKFAYASIFIVIGGWILFRFVGPALNLYQLDSPPLSPNSMFKG